MLEEEEKSFLKKEGLETKKGISSFDNVEEGLIEIKYDGSQYDYKELDKLALKDFNYRMIRKEVEKCERIIDSNDHTLGGFLRRSNRSFLRLISGLWAVLLAILYLENQEWFPFKMKKNSNMLSDMSYALITCSIIVGINAFYSIYLYKTKYSFKTARLLQEYLTVKDMQLFSERGFQVVLVHSSYNLLLYRKN